MTRKRSRSKPAKNAAKLQNTKPVTPSSGPEAGNQKMGVEISQYIFAFELLKHYPTVRSFMIKQPMKRSFGDTVKELFGSTKK
jgi:hypothetical protein